MYIGGYKVLTDLKNLDCCWVHPDLVNKLGLKYKKKIFIKFGLRSHEAKIYTSSEIEVNEIIISNNIIDYLILPLNNSYEMVLCGNELHIGPAIGILATLKEKNLDKNISALTNYCYCYQQIKGAIFAFSLDCVNMQNNTIRGYLYNPQTKKWDKNNFAYPSVIFKRTGINKVWRNHFHSLLGDRVFNDYIFNKWEMFQWLSEFHQFKKHLPDCNLYNSCEELRKFIKIHKKIYFKPISGSQGIGIMQIRQEEKRFLVKHFQNGELKEEAFNEFQELKRFLKENINEGKYIMQQSIDLISHEGKIIDFRLIVLKNGQGDWEDIGIVARYGKDGSIVSNVSSGGCAELGETTLQKVLKLDDRELFRLRKKMSRLALDIASGIEEIGIHCGNLGVDMGIDSKGQMWIIEVNNRDPNHTIAIDAGNKQMFYRSKLATMLYARRLAGFSEE